LVDSGEVLLCLSPATLAEIQDVLSRPILRQRFPLLASQDSESLLRAIRSKAELLADIPKTIRLPRDPDDEIYLDLAVAANDDFLVTWTRDISLI
jgi:putative PIN family toxin of toxin-antitoxin system